MTLPFDSPEWVEAIVKTKYKDEHVMFAVLHDLNEDNKLQEGKEERKIITSSMMRSKRV